LCSLSQYMLAPSQKWIGALDGHYHDQAQFVREFRQFMGMTPSAYGSCRIHSGRFCARRAGAARRCSRSTGRAAPRA
jgi:hypothetical protein